MIVHDGLDIIFILYPVGVYIFFAFRVILHLDFNIRSHCGSREGPGEVVRVAYAGEESSVMDSFQDERCLSSLYTSRQLENPMG